MPPLSGQSSDIASVLPFPVDCNKKMEADAFVQAASTFLFKN